MSKNEDRQSTLTPKPIFRVEFAFKDLFEPSDQLAQWIANLSRALNDLNLASRRLQQGMADPTPPYEVIYDLKALAAHTWELVTFLNNSQAPEVESFIEDLPSLAQAGYSDALQILHLAESNASSEKKIFRNRLASARNQTSHYSGLDHKLLVQALRRLGEDDDGMAVLYAGVTVNDF